MNVDFSGLKVINLIGSEEFLPDLVQIIQEGKFPKHLKEFEISKV